MAKTELTLEEQLAISQGQVADLTKKSDAQAQTIAEQKGQLTSQGRELADKAKALAQATTTVGQHTQTIAQQKGQLDSLDKELAQATTTVGQHVERIRTLEAEAQANEVVLAGYQAQLRQAEAAGDGSTVVSHQEQLYRVVVPQFHFDGQRLTAEQLQGDATLVAKLVEAGSGVLEKVVS